ncbi:hypothetical protein OKW21_001857 [Catalinimonas alkaloidigena]|uniref:hypothetical protein n=1 Tax=Catalinimonas alkaloidigena TaxID=1075417 RepID=UPI002404B2AD|nr:hypothetical protein [Catalinimonas alkaloidigena]MDF9796594.1 hypothetical protein [Catalinimonas alkaloidigena]
MNLRLIRTAVAISMLMLSFTACHACDDCLVASSKRILLQYEGGNHLWFGEPPAYYPDSVQLLLSDQQSLPLESDRTQELYNLYWNAIILNIIFNLKMAA